jgi:hypothetical protein
MYFAVTAVSEPVRNAEIQVPSMMAIGMPLSLSLRMISGRKSGRPKRSLPVK